MQRNVEINDNENIKVKKATYKKVRYRVTGLFIIFCCSVCFLVHSVFSDWLQIITNIRDKNKLDIKYQALVKEEQRLNSEVIKLQDKEYVLIYAREKYGYTKDGELIIRINGSNKESEE